MEKPSGLPRPSQHTSRLPLPRTGGVRPTPSLDNLQQSRLGVSNPRLRSTPSREQLSTQNSRRAPPPLRSQKSSQQLRNREPSASAVIYNPVQESTLRKASGNALSRKVSRTVLREEEAATFAEDDEGYYENLVVDFEPKITPRKSRPSLSERAMDTLQNIPSSPAIRKRTSSFYNPESPMRPVSSGTQSSRPGSSSQNDTVMGPPSRTVTSRPTSSSEHGQSVPIDFRASTNTYKAPKSMLQIQTPVKRPSMSNLRSPSGRQHIDNGSNMTSKLTSPGFAASTQQRSPSPVRSAIKSPTIKSGSQTLASRPLRPRASVNGLFRKPSMQNLDQPPELDMIGYVPRKKLSNTSSEATSTISRASKATTTTSVPSEAQDTTPRKSSNALRDQIAKAKAAKRAAAGRQVHDADFQNVAEVPVIPTASFDFGLPRDPFNQQIRQDGAKGLLKKRIAAARSDGRLNIAAMGFKEIPEEVLTMYSLESIGTHDGSWAESVDLTRFVAAGNEIELVQDNVFPDVDPRDVMDDEDAQGNQFGALETLDLHGNLLIAIPMGLRRLDFLTTLNLANNKLNNDCFEVVTQIPSLRDLKLGNNGLVGPLDPRITELTHLETLDLQHNKLTSLPEGVIDLIRLRVLNITSNEFASLPFDSLERLPLIEVFAAKNKLSGTLIGPDVGCLSQLQILDVTGNSLSSLATSETLKLPSLHQLSISSNRLTALPNLASWISLRTLTAEDNNLTSIPEGFVTLSSLKNVDLSGNNIKVLDDRIGRMESLDIFRISGNPLREKKFSGMTTEDLKSTLKARLEPEAGTETETENDVDGDGAFYSAPQVPVSPNNPASLEWAVRLGILDRSNLKSHSLNPVAAAEVAANNTVKDLELHHNVFKEIPTSIAFFAATLTHLSLAHNELTSDTFLRDDLELPALKELNLSSNTFNSVQPLIEWLHAPNLERLDISFNRLTSLPPLKPHFPSLITLLASNNTIRELSPDSVKGLMSLDCSSNEINSLNARIGLLGGSGGLQRLDVSGNRFRVPKYTILEKGTEATLAWLRDRIPAGEGGSTDTNADAEIE